MKGKRWKTAFTLICLSLLVAWPPGEGASAAQQIGPDMGSFSSRGTDGENVEVSVTVNEKTISTEAPADGRSIPSADGGGAETRRDGGDAAQEAAEPEPSRIEKILSGQFPQEISRKLEQFGYRFFDPSVSTFAPANHVPVSDDYVLGPGDRFSVHLWGGVEQTDTATVSRDGKIVLPRLGALTVAGMTFSEAKRFLQETYSQYYPDFEMSVTMDELRTIEVFIFGEAQSPGAYTVSSLSTVLTALYAAGGPTKNGSLRSIRVVRNGSPFRTVDLYNFLTGEFRQGDLRLQTGDALYIPVLGPVAGIAGNVRRPAIYELNGKETIGELIELAGGVLPTGQLHNVVVERIEDHQQRTIRSFNLDPAAGVADRNLQMSLRDGDVVKIYPVHDSLQDVVYLQGHVKYPMEYERKPGMRLSDLLPSYESLKPEPYLERAEIIRLQPPDYHPEIIDFHLGQLLAGDESQNLPLEDGDRVFVYRMDQKSDRPQVTIKGEVRKAGTYRLFPGATIRDLIFQAGNLTNKAHLQEGILSRVVTTETGAERVNIPFSLTASLSGVANDNLELQADDMIYVYQIPNYADSLERSVTLKGEVRFPGEYAFVGGERLASVIERAGGLTEEAYPLGAKFYRKSVEDAQNAQLQQYIDRLEQETLSGSAELADLGDKKDQGAAMEQALEAKRQLLEKLRKTKVSGRMVLNLEEVIAMPSSSQNIPLKPGDTLVVEKEPGHVILLGEVYNQTAVSVEEGQPLSYYLRQVGGVTKDGKESDIYVVRADGSVVSKHQNDGFFGTASWDGNNKRWTLGGFDGLVIYPGDTIIVPRETEKYRWWSFAKDAIDAMYKVAVAAGIFILAD